ncbi:disease resistance protein RPP13-like [Panicum hallii]|uniref:disease resistance protein RPP13-like n=1 Tax=Panicum hallii TaxID=206008 RepID=UPI000DF4F089|nr:disease resistance protein RPP13-like [Panicum hallii]
MVASAAASAMGSFIGKLAAMLGENYQLAGKVRRGIRSLKDELSTMDAVLQELAEKDDDQIDGQTKDWRNKVRELSLDIEDCIDRFMLNRSHGGSKANCVRKAVRKVKILLQDWGLAEEIQELKSLAIEQSERAKRYDIHQCQRRDLVGMDGPRGEIMELLKAGEEKRHKVVSIYGTAGQGKTTLAMEVYRKISGPFDCRAFVSVSQTPDMKKLLRDILSQINKSMFEQSQSWETEQLRRTIREYLMDKR